MSVAFAGREVVRGVSFRLHAGELVALVGQSGSGKSQLCRALLGLPPKGARVSYELLERPAPEEMSLVMQDAMTALDPAMPVGRQIAEAGAAARGGTVAGRTGGSGLFRRIMNRRFSGRARMQDSVALLRRIGIDEAERRAGQYPGEFSGGMRQRAAVAVALAMRPKVIFADEPTTSLDAGMRMRIMELLNRIREEDGTAILFVTHDLSLVREFADRVLILKDGTIVEQGTADEIFANPREEYTKELLRYAAIGDPTNRTHHTHGRVHYHKKETEPLVWTEQLCKSYPLGYGRTNRVLDRVSIAIYPGEVAGLSGPSGIGKSTLARCLAGLEKPSGGRRFAREGLNIQMIFQDSVSALNPRMTAEQLIAEPLYLRDGKSPPWETILDLMRETELEPELLRRRPAQLSGGQRQRVAIARAIAARPDLIIADEPVSSLDVTTRSKIFHLLKKLKDEHGLTMLLISHDLPLLTHVSDRIVRI